MYRYVLCSVIETFNNVNWNDAKNVHPAKLFVLHETLLVFAFHFKIAISKIFPHVSVCYFMTRLGILVIFE